MFVQSLGETSKDLNSLAYTLLRIFRQANQEIELIKTITSRELNNRGRNLLLLFWCCILELNGMVFHWATFLREAIFRAKYIFIYVFVFVEKKETLFRGNTLATKLMDQYMKMVAIPYLQSTIKSVILKIMESRQNCEVRFSKQDFVLALLHSLTSIGRYFTGLEEHGSGLGFGLKY